MQTNDNAIATLAIRHTMSEACDGLPPVGAIAILLIEEDSRGNIRATVHGGGPVGYLARRITAEELLAAMPQELGRYMRLANAASYERLLGLLWENYRDDAVAILTPEEQ